MPVGYSENIHMSNTIKTQQVIFRNIYMHVATVNELKEYEFEREQRDVCGECGARKGNKEMV